MPELRSRILKNDTVSVRKELPMMLRYSCK